MAPTAVLARPVPAPPALEDRVRRILTDHFLIGGEVLTDGARIREDLDADSLDEIELTIAIEEEFGIEVPNEEIEATTVGDVIQAVRRMVDAGASATGGRS